MNKILKRKIKNYPIKTVLLDIFTDILTVFVCILIFALMAFLLVCFGSAI